LKLQEEGLFCIAIEINHRRGNIRIGLIIIRSRAWPLWLQGLTGEDTRVLAIYSL
jgi:hypothetical protein